MFKTGISSSALRSPNVLLVVSTCWNVSLAAAPCAVAALRLRVRQRVLLGRIAPIGPMCSFSSLKGPSVTHPPARPPPPKRAPRPPKSPASGFWAADAVGVAPEEPEELEARGAPLPPKPETASKSGDLSQEPPPLGVSRCQSQSGRR
jgi:hypothetical protein